jgi:hypothetical protein
MSEIHSIPVRVSSALREKLEVEAKEKEVSLSATVRMLLKEAFSKRSTERSAA